MFGKRSKHKGELIIPPTAAENSSSVEVIRGWVVEGGFHVSLELVWADPATWGIAFADIARHLAEAYYQTKGLDKEDTINRILHTLNAERIAPTDTPSGQLIE